MSPIASITVLDFIITSEIKNVGGSLCEFSHALHVVLTLNIPQSCRARLTTDMICANFARR
jgi:hypothetical protein